MENEMTKYNGWTNYETWNVKLWMDNDEGSYNYFRELAQETYKQSESEYDWQTKMDAAKYNLAEFIKDYFDEINPLADTADTFSDLLGAALSNVNWYEIAESLLDDIEEMAA
jgi:hypothetical protein